MAKDTAFKTELSTKSNPRIFRKGYMFREIGPDANGVRSSFHDAKTMQDGVFDRQNLAIHMDPNADDWDLLYGSVGHCSNTLIPSRSELGTDKWTFSNPAGGLGTIEIFRAGATSTIGNLRVAPTTVDSQVFTRSNIIDDISTTTGNFTYEFRMKTSSTVTNGLDFYRFKLKVGQFHTEIKVFNDKITIGETGAGLSASVVMVTNSVDVTEPNGQYVTVRVVIDRQAVNPCLVFINGASPTAVSKTINNGTAADNELSFGVPALPTANSAFLIQYVAYINAPIYPMEACSEDWRPYETTAANALTTGPFPYTKTGTENNSTSINIRSNLGDIGALGYNRYDYDNDIMCTRIRKNSAGTLTYTRTVSSTNSVGWAYEVRAKLDSTGTAAGNTEFKIEDGTRQFTLTLRPGSTTQFNGVTVTDSRGDAIQSYRPHTYRIVVKGTGASSAINAYLYVDRVLCASQSVTTATANNVITITPHNMNASGGTSYTHIYYTKYWKNKPFHVTRYPGIPYVSPILGASFAFEVAFSTGVTKNELDTYLATPRLSTATVFQRDMCWGSSGHTSLPNLKFRGSNSVFTTASASPGFSTVTVPTDSQNRDPITKSSFIYFEAKMVFTDREHEMTFIRFHRSLEVTDYITNWGSSTFEKDFISRKINIGDLRIDLLNSNDDFDLFRTRPDIWTNCGFEIWIGAITDSGTFEYPDFVGTIYDMVFNNNEQLVSFEINNVMKKFNDITLNSPDITPIIYPHIVYAGDFQYRLTPVVDQADNKIYNFNSKYDLVIHNNSSVPLLFAGSNDGSGTPSFCLNKPGRIYFGSTPTGTVYGSLHGTEYYDGFNAASLLRTILQVEGKLLLNLDIDNISLTTFESNITTGVHHIILDDTNMISFLENILTQSAGSMFISSENQTALGFLTVGIASTSHSSITDKTLQSSTLHTCENILINNPVENVLNIIDVTYTNEANTNFLDPNANATLPYTYYNTRTVGNYDSASPNASLTIINVFGKTGPSQKVLNNTTDFFNISTEYLFIRSTTSLDSVLDDNFAIFGFRPPIYELQNTNTNTFLYNMGDTLYIHRSSASTPDDSIIITRLEKDYDNLMGNIQGISSVLFESPGGF